MNKVKPFFISGIIFVALTYSVVAIRAEHSTTDDLEQAKALYYQNIESGRQEFSRIVNSDPQNEIARLNLIRILRETGQYQTAINQLKILLQQNPNDQNYRSALIECTYMAGAFSETLRISNGKDLTPNELYWKGLALGELGIQTEAIQALSQSVEGQPFHPLAYYNLGLLYLKTFNYEKAVAYFKKAATQDPDISQLYLPLANAYIGQGQPLTAYHYLLIAKDEMSWNPEVEIAIRNLLVDYPEILKPKSGGSSRPERVTFPPKVTPIMDNREKIPEIRIGLAETIQRLYLRTGERFQIIDQNGKVRFIGKAQTVLLIRQRNSGIEILTRQGVSLFKSAGSVSLTYNNPAATSVLLEVQYQHGTFWAGREDRIYRGNFQFLPRDSGLTIVNQLNLEEYLYGVVPSEMESDWPPEALAAQAVAARTYAVSHHNAFTSRGFDLLATIASQVYQGVLAERNSTNKAVDATRGQILIFNDKPISAFYTGNSGGYTASSQDLWGDTLIPYLQAVPDRLLPTGSQIMSPEELAQWLILRPVTYSCNPKYSAPSHYRWTIWVSRTEIETHLRLADKVGAINSIVISERTKSGIVTKVTVNGVNGTFNLTGDAIRSKLGGLRSNMFIIEPKLAQNGLPEYFIFYGGGFGHGVGMDQSGAAGMAADGYKYDQILNHYYSGSELKQLY